MSCFDTALGRGMARTVQSEQLSYALEMQTLTTYSPCTFVKRSAWEHLYFFVGPKVSQSQTAGQSDQS